MAALFLKKKISGTYFHMARLIFGSILWYCCALLSLSFNAQASLFASSTNTVFAPVDQAFAFDFQQEKNELHLTWQILPGYYLYQQQISLTASQAVLGPFALPKGQEHYDEFFGKVQIYTQQLQLKVPLRSATDQSSLTVTYQGCAEAGYCYPPETRVIPLNSISPVKTNLPAEGEPLRSIPDKPITTPLPFSPLWALLFGVLIAFTPCVLPMYPLISGLILGRKQALSSGRILLLSVVYVQGMALTYTLLGLLVAALGLQFQAALQHPYVLITLSVAFVLLALSMFGFYTLQLPSSLQTRLTHLSNTQNGGSIPAVFIMGAIAGLICSPCTTAPLSAILLYIAQSGHLLSGGITLYLYALGMGIPLIVVTLFGNRLLPRSGPWMQYVKEGFGFVILALPVFLIERLVGETWGIKMWAILGFAFFSWGFTLSLRGSNAFLRILQLILLAAALICIRPLQDWVFDTPHQQPIQKLAFQPVSSINTLEQSLAAAKGQKVMLDLYADWCVACKEYEKYTFSDPKVQEQLSKMLLLKADVTANNPQDKALYNKFNVKGLPALLFFDEQGNELPEKRINGFLNAASFLQHLKSMQP